MRVWQLPLHFDVFGRAHSAKPRFNFDVFSSALQRIKGSGELWSVSAAAATNQRVDACKCSNRLEIMRKLLQKRATLPSSITRHRSRDIAQMCVVTTSEYTNYQWRHDGDKTYAPGVSRTNRNEPFILQHLSRSNTRKDTFVYGCTESFQRTKARLAFGWRWYDQNHRKEQVLFHFWRLNLLNYFHHKWAPNQLIM